MTQITNKDLYEAIQSLTSQIDDTYLRKDVFESRFEPVRKVVYGLVGAILMAVIGAILAVALRT